jgi:hypothetical protein
VLHPPVDAHDGARAPSRAALTAARGSNGGPGAFRSPGGGCAAHGDACATNAAASYTAASFDPYPPPAATSHQRGVARPAATSPRSALGNAEGAVKDSRTRARERLATRADASTSPRPDGRVSVLVVPPGTADDGDLPRPHTPPMVY